MLIIPGGTFLSDANAGLDTFTGTVMHSARWDHDHDLAGERVAVIGTGASAVQFVPEIQPRVADLHLFQRTAHWVLPKVDHHVPDARQPRCEAAPRRAGCDHPRPGRHSTARSGRSVPRSAGIPA